MALTNPTRLIDLSELNYFRTKLNTETDKKYVQPNNITAVNGLTDETPNGTVDVTFAGTGTGAQSKTITLAGSGGAFSVTGDTNKTVTFTVDAAATYAIEAVASTDQGYDTSYAAQYRLMSGGVQQGALINIPKDFLVRSATSSIVTAEDKAAGGKFENDSNYAVGDAYLDFVVNTADSSETATHIYVNVNDLFDSYTSGNGITVDNDTNTIAVNIDSTNANGLSVSTNGLALAAATTSAAGAMSAADKTKLDSLVTITTVGNGLDLTSGTLTAVAGNGAVSVNSNGINVVVAANQPLTVDATNGLTLAIAETTDIDEIFA